MRERPGADAALAMGATLAATVSPAEARYGRNGAFIGGLAVGGLTLPGLLRARAEHPAAKKKSVILIWLNGGPYCWLR